MNKFKWDRKYLYWGVTAFCVIIASIAFFWVLNSWSGIKSLISVIINALAPFITGFLIAYLLRDVLRFFERLLNPLTKKLFPKDETRAVKSARIGGIVISELLALGIVACLLVAILPQIYYSIISLIGKSKTYFNTVVTWVSQYFEGDSQLEETALKLLNNISAYIISWVENSLLPRVTSIITNITGGVITLVSDIFGILVGVVVSIYILYHKETFKAQGKKMVYSFFKPKTANRIIQELDYVNKAFGNYIVGEILDSAIVGIINYAFLLMLGMPYAALISLIMCITNLIPVFGPFIGAIPSALLILLENPLQCLIFIIFTVIFQQIDGNVIKPRIHASRSGLSGLWVMFSILFFGGLFGIPGMVLGVPVFSVIYDWIKRYNARRLKERGLPVDTPEYKEIRMIDPETNTPIYFEEEVGDEKSGIEKFKEKVKKPSAKSGGDGK